MQYTIYRYILDDSSIISAQRVSGQIWAVRAGGDRLPGKLSMAEDIFARIENIIQVIAGNISYRLR